MKQFGIATGLLLSAILGAPAFAQTPQLLTEEMMVKTGDPGIEIYVRNKRPANMTSFRPEQTVLYVHGERKVNLNVIDHRGNQRFIPNVRLVQPGEERPNDWHAVWMPYQVGQAAKHAEAAAK